MERRYSPMISGARAATLDNPLGDNYTPHCVVIPPTSRIEEVKGGPRKVWRPQKPSIPLKKRKTSGER
jgi:hypothetical protein